MSKNLITKYYHTKLLLPLNNNMNKFYLAIVFSIIVVTAGNTQNVLADGNKYFAKGMFYEAATCYEKVLGVNKPSLDKVQGYTPYGHKKMEPKKPLTDTKAPYNRDEVVYKLAESYRSYTEYTKAEKYYKKAADSSKTNFPLSRYWYAICLRSNKKYKEAEAQYNQFIASYAADDIYKKGAYRELEILKNIARLTSNKDSALYTVVKMDSARINPGGANTSPSWLSTSTLLFTSSRLDSTDLVGIGKKHPFVANHIYSIGMNNGKLTGEPVRISFANDTFMLDKGATAVTPDGKKMFFEICQHVQDKKVYSILVSELKNNVWGEPVKVGKTVNVEGYSSKQPFITSDGKYLLFASDRPGGYGGFDLWYAELGRDYYVLDAYNFGEVINSFGDEQAPYYHTTTHNLVFSSNGRIGMGGFDLYRSKGTIKGTWTVPANLGYPANSSKDELDFVSQENAPLLDNVYFSSDKGDVCCPQIYNLHKVLVPKTFTGIVLDSISHEPVSNALVIVTDSITGKELYSYKTDNTGKYSFKSIQLPSLSLNASKEEYTKDQANYTGMEHLEELEANAFELPALQIRLIKKHITPPDIIIYFEFDSSSVTALGKLQLDSMVDRLKADTSLTIEIQGNTDGKGSKEYNERLGKNRALTCYNYFLKKDVAKKNLSLVTFGMDHPVDKNTLEDGTDNPEGRAHNRRVEFRILKQAKE